MQPNARNELLGRDTAAATATRQPGKRSLQRSDAVDDEANMVKGHGVDPVLLTTKLVDEIRPLFLWSA